MATQQTKSPAQTHGNQTPSGTRARGLRKSMVGIVTSDKMQKTVVVKVSRKVKDPLYQKYVVRKSKFKAHDEKNEAKVGDRVLIYETKPISKDKKWKVGKILTRAVEV